MKEETQIVPIPLHTPIIKVSIECDGEMKFRAFSDYDEAIEWLNAQWSTQIETPEL